MTLEEILKAQGLSDDQIKGMDAKVTAALGGVLTAAEQKEAAATAAAEEAAVLTRKQEEWWNTTAAPQINQQFSATATAQAEAAFYRAQAEAAKSNGFVPKDAPTYDPNKPAHSTAQPTAAAVPASGTPGAPRYLTQTDAYSAITNATDTILEYQRLYGAPMPDSMATLAQEAREKRLSVPALAAQKYNFEGKRAEIVAAKQKEHDDKIRAEATAETEKKYAERMGSNPNLRPAAASQFSGYREGAGSEKYPGSMTPAQRHAHVSKFIKERHISSTVN